MKNWQGQLMDNRAKKPTCRRAIALHLPTQLRTFPFSAIGQGQPHFEERQEPLHRAIAQQLRMAQRYFTQPFTLQAPCPLVVVSNHFLWQVCQRPELRKRWRFFLQKNGTHLACQPWVFTWRNPNIDAWQEQVFRAQFATCYPNGFKKRKQPPVGANQRLHETLNYRKKSLARPTLPGPVPKPNHLQQDAFQAWYQVWENSDHPPKGCIHTQQLIALLDLSLYKAMDTSHHATILKAFDAFINYMNILADLKIQNSCHPGEP